ncbi:YcaO-like family protein [Amycolatopsis sp. cg9]|uniref:YcaO-like family protein n=1 Tax=Amycolatopsis sp. cg9 TaxID=3238801 RepID=UPI0035252538
MTVAPSMEERTGGPVLLEGTIRDRTPERTWELVRPRLRDYGITRVAELTGLDTIGMPVYMAVRPLGHTLGVSQGKGATPLLAKVSAVMEAIEYQICEQFQPADTVVATAGELGVPYSTTEITPLRQSLVSDSFPLQWVPATLLHDATPTFVPLHAIALDGISDDRWRPRTLFSTTNGLASGNTLAEATVHALLEVVERFSCAAMAKTPIRRRNVVDLDSLPECWSKDLIDRMRADDFWVEVVECSAVPGTSTFAVYVWRADMPSLYAGSGCHVLPELALQRALTEAVQSRMSVISGMREDIGKVGYRGVRNPIDPPAVEPNRTWTDVAPGLADPATPSAELVEWLTGQVTARSGRPVLRVDLTPPGEVFAVCKVVVPGLPELHHEANEELPRPAPEAEEAP